MLTVISIYFLSNDITPVSGSYNLNQTLNNKTNTKNKVILFSTIGSAGGLSLFLCVCHIIISVCIFKKLKCPLGSHHESVFTSRT